MEKNLHQILLQIYYFWIMEKVEALPIWWKNCVHIDERESVHSQCVYERLIAIARKIYKYRLFIKKFQSVQKNQ